MKLWTIQPIEFYDKLIKDGEIYTLEKYADPHFKETYKWMIKEMENRIDLDLKIIYFPFGLGINIRIVLPEDLT
ncbi:DUF3841 domain-containing protein [Tenacibaculum aiptasiae]|uniref:DUF3841 domain-containing protein n=1 Tax=Tenacibaculum aiptasiae TaxID=426481 RepID=UPI00232C0FA6|nr:DUF3841 domain-containing protein [Tenacibaculum aiptasiae]